MNYYFEMYFVIMHLFWNVGVILSLFWKLDAI